MWIGTFCGTVVHPQLGTLSCVDWNILWYSCASSTRNTVLCGLEPSVVQLCIINWEHCPVWIGTFCGTVVHPQPGTLSCVDWNLFCEASLVELMKAAKMHPPLIRLATSIKASSG